MREIVLVLKREWEQLAGSDTATHVLFLFLVVLWSLLFTTADDGGATRLVWVVTFSVIVVNACASGPFMHERLSGALEIVLTCGIARDTLYRGKVLFVTLVATVLGGICTGLSGIWELLLGRVSYGDTGAWQDGFAGVVTFAFAAFMNACCAALFSVLLPNPRFVFFFNFLITSVIVALFLVVHALWGVSTVTLNLMLVVPGLVFLEVGKRVFRTERVVRPATV